MSQKGLAPILVVLLLSALVGGYLIYQKQAVTNPTNILPNLSPSIQPTSTPQPSPTSKLKTIPTPTVTATPIPSPSVSPGPTAKPSPVPGSYQLDLQPTSNIETSTASYGYAASILLKDSNGDTIHDQSDFTFSASIDNSNIADIQLNQDNDSCKAYNIKYAYGYQICPNFKLSITPKQAGSTKIPVKATQKSTGKVVATGAYSLTIK